MIKDIKTDMFRELKNKNVPVQMHWELTNSCNENCLHCLRDKRRVKELSQREIGDILLQLKEEGCFTVSFSGGEPFLRKDFLDILKLADRLGFKIMICSNGTLINERHIQVLKRVRIGNIQISLYGATPEMHDSITQVKGSYEKTLYAIRLLKKYKIPFKTATMCFNKNFPEWALLRQMGRKEGWNMVFDCFIFPTYSGGRMPLRLRLTDEQIRTARKSKFLKWRSDLKVQDRKRKPPISALGLNPSISAQGDIHANVLMRIKLGSLRKESFHEIWHNSPVTKRLRRLKEKQFDCYRCKYYNSCCRMPEMAFLEEGNFLLRPKEICRINKIAQENSYKERYRLCKNPTLKSTK